MDSFAQIPQWLPKGNATTSSSYYGNATPFKVEVKFEIPIFECQIDVDIIDKWINLLEGYFSFPDFFSREKLTFTLLKATLHIKDW